MLTIKIPGSFFMSPDMRFAVKITQDGKPLPASKTITNADLIGPRGEIKLQIDHVAFAKLAQEGAEISLEAVSDAPVELLKQH